jgi:hypothetical protein
MTCAGICALAICRHELGEKDPANDPAIQHGLAWLDKYFKASEHPIDRKEWYFYYMYSLERVGRILDTEFIGANEWYPLGAAALIGKQNTDGTWAAAEGDEMDPRLATSFALLFLTRATASLKPVVHTGPGALRTAAIAPNNQLPAAKGSELERTVRTAVLGLPDEYLVLNDAGKEIARGHFGEPQQLPEGHYKFQARFGGRDITDDFWINAGEPTDITFDASQLPPAKQ